MSTKITDLRGSRLRPIRRGSVLLSKQEDLCSTSYYVEPAVNRQPGFRRELVEQITSLITTLEISFMRSSSNIDFQIQKFLLRISSKFENFIIFSTFWRRGGGVRNKGLIEHGSWKSQKIELQYDIKDLNVTN